MQPTQPLVSVIIPVYNSKKRLAACLDHVAAMNYPNLEVILVDDCSTDGSLEICREYEKKYPHFHVITKENEGVSAARNLGMQESHGQYIQFVDSEAFVRDFPELFSSYFLHVPWNKLYRRDVIEKGFPTDLDKGEDLLFNLQVFERAGKISVLPKSVYDYYNIETGSLTFRFREDAMEIEERLRREVAAFYEKCGGKEAAFLDVFYLNSIKNKFYDLMRRSGKTDRECKEKIKDWLAMPGVQQLFLSKAEFSRKDKILLFFMKHRNYRILLKYYR